MYTFILNGKEVSYNENINLLEYLREDANLTSVKNGCGEGACGACMILINGVPGRACLNTLEKIQGKEVTTVEGLSEFEKQVFAYAFSKVGAVQCGFCIPGMVISAKALIDKNNEPSEEEIKVALRGNICRCTGYVKIIEGVKLAASFIKSGSLVIDNRDEKKEEGKKSPQCINSDGAIGNKIPRVDAIDKILGTAIYVDDMKVPSMVYGSALRAKYPRALVKSIDISKAAAHKDALAVVTAKDIPGERNLGHLVKDWPALIAVGEETRYVGDAIALVAAKTKKALKEILSLIEVDYEERKPLTCPTISLQEEAPKLHKGGNVLRVERLRRGNVEEALKSSKYVVTNMYSTPFTEHGFLEPEAALAMPDEDGVLIYTGSQGIYDEQREISELLGLPKDKVRCISRYVGGGFGGKEDMSVQHHAALLAYITKLPVKVTLSRKESILVHPKRHAMEMKITTGCDEEGHITAFKAEIVSDTGAYASLGGPVLQRACTHAAGPYRCKNIDIKGMAVYTNNPPAGAFRGFGVTQTVFGGECNLNQLAEAVGISPWEIRYRNVVEPGDELPNGQIADESTAIKETLLAVKNKYYSSEYAGVACCMKNSGLGVGVPDTGRSRILVKNGKVHIRTSAACMGQGIATTMIQIACEATGFPMETFELTPPDTFDCPNAGTSTASRQTVFTGEATRIAALKFLEDVNKIYVEDNEQGITMQQYIKDNGGKLLKLLEGKDYLGEYTAITDPINSTKENPVSHVAYGYATQVAILDKDGKLKEVVAAHDVGRAINPINVEGQIEGGVVMSLGYALTEDYPLKASVPIAKFGTLGIFRASMIPKITPIIIEKNQSTLVFGAKGVGEITAIPTAPAVQGAYYALDGNFRRKLPLEMTFYSKR